MNEFVLSTTISYAQATGLQLEFHLKDATEDIAKGTINVNHIDHLPQLMTAIGNLVPKK